MSRRTPVTKTLGRPRSVDSTETRSNLLIAARRTFTRDGYGATTNRNIADAAGITTAAIYHYFPSKADLYKAVYLDVQSIVDDCFDVAMRQPGRLADRFGWVLDAASELNRQDTSIAGFIVAMPVEIQRHGELGELRAAEKSRTIPFIAQLVEEAVTSDEFVEGVNPSAVEDLLTAVISGLTVLSTLTQDPDRHLAAVGALKRFLSGELVRRFSLGPLPTD
ncbi:MAG: TetR/AcrR family transcriptional regulator [Ilumatobacteraceae bacterium]